MSTAISQGEMHNAPSRVNCIPHVPEPHNVELQGPDSVLVIHNQTHAMLSRLCEDDFRATAQSLLKDYVELRPQFFTDPVFLEWQRGRPWYLYCEGESRCGKSTFAAAISSWLQEHRQNNACLVLSLFLGHANNRARFASISAVLGAILRQVLEQKDESEWSQATRDHLASEGAFNSADKLQRCIIHEISGFEEVFLVVDGLNDIPTNDVVESHEQHLAELLAVAREASCGLRLLIMQSSNDGKARSETEEIYCDAIDSFGTTCNTQCENDLYWSCRVCEELNEGFYICYSCHMDQRSCLEKDHILQEPYQMRVLTIRSVLTAYIQQKLQSQDESTYIGRRLRHARAILPHIEKEIERRSQDVFLIAKLYLDSLIEHQSVEEILDIQDRLPSSQRMYYESTINEILSQQPQEKDRALTALSLIAVSGNGRNPSTSFSLSELGHATSLLTDTENIELTEAQLLRCTRGLAIVVRNDSEIVRAFHDSTLTYLLQECEAFKHFLRTDLDGVCLELIESCTTSSPTSFASLDEASRFLRDKPALSYALRTLRSLLATTDASEAAEAARIHFTQLMSKNLAVRQITFLASNNSRSEELWTIGKSFCATSWYKSLDNLPQLSGEHLNPENQDPVNGKTPLHFACEGRQVRMATLLLKAGADPSITDHQGRNPIWELVDRNDQATLRELLQNTANLQQLYKAVNATVPTEGGQTALMLAIQNAGSELQFSRNTECVRDQDVIVELLMEYTGVDLLARDIAGRTALHVAASVGSLHAIIKRFSDSIKSIDLDVQDSNRRTPFMTALSSGKYNSPDRKEAMEDLCHCLQHIRDLEIADDSQRTLLHYAVQDSALQPILEYLLAKGASVNFRDTHGRTPAHVAVVSSRDPEIVSSLVEHKANLYIKDVYNMTPYNWAEQMDCHDVKKWLVVEGGKTEPQHLPLPWDEKFGGTEAFPHTLTELSEQLVRRVCPQGLTLLHEAVYSGEPSVMETLLQSDRVDIDGRDLACQTALHLTAIEDEGENSAMSDRMKMAKLLIDHGANINAPDYEGMTTLQRLMSKPRPLDPLIIDVVLTLIENDAHLMLSLEDRRDLLSHAIRRDRINTVAKLLQGNGNIFLYGRPGMLPSEIASAEDRASSQMLELLRRFERDIFGRIE